LAPIKALLHTPSPVELCGALLLTYAINTAVLMLFKSKRLLMIDALKVARQGVRLRRTP
jgi:hypothetical protein